MRAVVCDRYGPPEVLRLEEVARPVPAEGEVLVNRRAVVRARPALLALALYLPFTVAMMGIVFRGAAFAFRAHFRRRAMAALVSGVLAMLSLAIADFEAPRLLQSLTGRGVPLFVLALLNGPL